MNVRFSRTSSLKRTDYCDRYTHALPRSKESDDVFAAFYSNVGSINKFWFQKRRNIPSCFG